MTTKRFDPDVKRLANVIGGELVAPRRGRYLPNLEPATGEAYGELPDSDESDVADAVAAAQAALPVWSRKSVAERSAILMRVADLIEANAEALAAAESRDQGKPRWLARELDIPRAAANFRFFAAQIVTHQEHAARTDDRAINYVDRRPVGVAGLISPWNLPLYLLTWKLAPALAVGATAVAKPSELTSMTAYLLAALLAEAGVPAGAANLVFGRGPTAGAALTAHPQVPAISFTGGTVTAQAIIAGAAPHLKKLSLELGGKNATVVFADCDFEKAVATSVRAAFLNQGEICLCGSRILVEASLYPRFLAEFTARAKALTVGDPATGDAFLGALVSEGHRDKVLGMIAQARRDGGKIEAGGGPVTLPGRLARGYFVAPTVITGLAPTCEAMQEEIFGPVVTVTPFASEDEAVALANGVRYGLAASLFTRDLARAHRVASALDVGQVWVNTWMLRDLRVPFGGVKSSGIGREGGAHSLDFFTETKNVCIALG